MRGGHRVVPSIYTPQCRHWLGLFEKTLRFPKVVEPVVKSNGPSTERCPLRAQGTLALVAQKKKAVPHTVLTANEARRSRTSPYLEHVPTRGPLASTSSSQGRFTNGLACGKSISCRIYWIVASYSSGGAFGGKVAHAVRSNVVRVALDGVGAG